MANRKQVKGPRVHDSMGPNERKVWLRVGLAAAAIGIVALLIFNNSSDSDGGDSTTVQHIHGMAVDPQDPANVYLATHHGLFYGNEDAGWERVGKVKDDLMGFTIDVDGERLWSSGHPVSGGNMGVRLSQDGGESWEYLALDGVDFHAMTISPADDATMWGTFAGQLYRSLDAGQTWTTIGPAPAGAFSLSAHPADADTLYASGQNGILRSLDGGATWEGWVNTVTTHVAFAAPDGSSMVAIGPDGIRKSIDAGATWQSLGGTFDGVPSLVAVHPGDADILYLSTFNDAVYKSTDGGVSWDLALGA